MTCKPEDSSLARSIPPLWKGDPCDLVGAAKWYMSHGVTPEEGEKLTAAHIVARSMPPSYYMVSEIEEMMEHLMHVAHETAKDKGWWTNPETAEVDLYSRNDGELIANMHSELSEFWESYRKPGREPSTQCEGFYNDEIELADLCIRLFDFCKAREYRLPQAITAKMRYNHTRDFRHGGKRA